VAQNNIFFFFSKSTDGVHRSNIDSSLYSDTTSCQNLR